MLDVIHVLARIGAWLLMRYFAPPTGQYSSRLNVVPGCATANALPAQHPMHAPMMWARLDVQVIEQPLALRHVMRPRDALDPSARLAGLATVEDDAGVSLSTDARAA